MWNMSEKTMDQEKTSRSLEVISSREIPSTSQAERRRLVRLNLTGEQFRLHQTGKIFSVTDLSSRGMALRILDQSDYLLFPVATEFTGTLNLKGEKLELACRVRHLGSDQIGCEFEKLSAETQTAVDRFLDPVALGRELKPIPSSEGGTLWYHGSSGTDLLFKRGADGQYSSMTLYLLGNIVQWRTEGGLATGRARPSDEQSESRGVLRFETVWFDPDAKVDQTKLGVAKTLILSSNLPEDFKKWCLRRLEESV
jgi:hypothetical protein